jgi:hypothetical protein
MKLYDTTGAAEVLELHLSRILRFCKDGRLGQKVGSRYVIDETDLERFKQIPRPAGRPRKKKVDG